MIVAQVGAVAAALGGSSVLTKAGQARRFREARAFALATIAAVAALVVWAQLAEPVVIPIGETNDQGAAAFYQAEDVARTFRFVAWYIGLGVMAGLFLAQSMLPGMSHLRKRAGDHRLRGDMAVGLVGAFVATAIAVSADPWSGQWAAIVLVPTGDAWIVIPGNTASVTIFGYSTGVATWLVGLLVIERLAQRRAAHAPERLVA
jgi:hypothetical protein